VQLIPAVDVLEGKVVRLHQGDYRQVTHYGEDPVETALSFVEQGAALVHVVDLRGAKTGLPDTALWWAMGRSGVPFQVGGGIRTPAMAEAAFEAGAARVVMGTAAVWDPRSLATVSPTERVIAALDVRSDRATGAGWIDAGKPLEEVLAALLEAGVTRALVTGIVRDGTMQGPDLGLISTVQQIAPHLRIIASGGVGALVDIEVLAAAGCEAVVVGRALYEGRFSLAEALAAAAGPLP
jgi:phosphoribosylformimino-5-aminoimidazole carboxamide ribotide isomerase